MAYVALGGHNGDDGRNITINWDSTAAVDYFGSPSENFAYSEHILRTLALASGVDTGWRNGGDDLANRAILVACNDPMDRCKSVSTAYTYNGLGQDAPLINYCPAFFRYFRSHDETWHRMRDGPAPDNAWSNVRNLHSQATVALHQFLHINSSWPANVCAGGCKDTLQELDRGREMVWTYRAGLAKLLARRNAMAASQTVDNYVYYVMSRWIEVKNANEYPPYPVAWNPDQSRRWNEDREASEPGTPLPVTAALDIEDSDVAYEERPGIYAPVYAKEMYPKWYAPILEAMDSESGNVTVDVQQPLVKRSAPYETRDPFSSTIRCNSTATSPEYFDCVHAFQADSYRQIPVHRGKKRENHWVAVQ
ncbi:glycoside hydrolase family 18 [Apiospora arundinis]|uniref:Glycoside hydrolase family 18 n=1 Tax=Apiospora arundinis TaxID=335852 RepID=A0ABR2I4A4_9PEZI